MAIKLFENIRNFFTKQSYQDRQNNTNIPFIHLIGHEKVYGKPQPNNYAAMVAEYKSWAYACAWKNATSVAKCKLCLKKPSYDNRKEKRDYVEIDEHPFLDLIKKANPFMNKFELFTITTLNLELTGNAYWYTPLGPLGIPEAVWNIPSHWVKIVPSPREFISGYVVTIPGKGTPIPFDESEVVHFKYPNPADLFYGAGPLWGSRLAVDLGNQIKEWGINFFLNNAQPSGILTTETSLSPEQYQRLKDQWNEKYKGSRNAGKMAFLENGLKYQQMGSNIKDSRMDQITPEIRDEILAIFGVPASKLGLESHDNRATAEASDYTYQSETIVPRLHLIQEKLQEKLIPFYDERLIVEFEDNVGEDKEFKLKERQINIQSGFSSIDELRIEEGLDPYDLPETSVPLISFGLNPAGQPKPEPIIPPIGQNTYKKKAQDKWEDFVRNTHPIEKSLTQAMQRFFQKQNSEVMRKLMNMKSVKKDLFSNIIFNLNEENTDLENKTRSYVDQSLRLGYTLGAKDLGTTIDFTLFSPTILRAVEERVKFLSYKVNEATYKLLGEELSEGLSKGESISKLAGRVDKVFNYSKDYRSLRIAQTEVIGATNEGQLRLYQDQGIKRKEWVTARDGKVRDSHRAMEGQIVDINESFTSGVGNRLRFPGDRSGNAPAEEVINCRCTVNPVSYE